ncbi:hypothetical protein OPQ81_001697 [Rhizoctonia solani]|nr:hypothetical protein OPQ81_001697 [Rhizoctonia solani]
MPKRLWILLHHYMIAKLDCSAAYEIRLLTTSSSCSGAAPPPLSLGFVLVNTTEMTSNNANSNDLDYPYLRGRAHSLVANAPRYSVNTKVLVIIENEQLEGTIEQYNQWTDRYLVRLNNNNGEQPEPKWFPESDLHEMPSD